MTQQTMTAAEIRARGRVRRGKYGATTKKADKPTMDGYTFDSKAERRRYVDLKLMERAGIITDLEVHPKPPYQLVAYGVKVSRYSPDFRYRENGELVVEDFKSGPTRTRDYVMRRKLMKACHGITIRETMAEHGRRMGG